jgi:hypothetical protein
MHTIHYIAVEAEDIQEAFDYVESELESEENFADWSDWHVVGGGRWNIQEGEKWEAAYEKGKSNMVISYADNPDLFKKTLLEIRKARMEEIRHSMANINMDKFTSDMVEYISNNGSLPEDIKYGDLNSYYVLSAAKMIRDYYTPTSYFFDLVDWNGASVDYVEERLDNPDTSMRQYLVPVDFHY